MHRSRMFGGSGLGITHRGASCTGPAVFVAVVGCPWDHKLLREAVVQPDLAAKLVPHR
jgi:hypothetical protein